MCHCSDGATELTDHALNDILAMTSQDMQPVVGAGAEDNRLAVVPHISFIALYIFSQSIESGPQLKKHCSSRPDMELAQPLSSSDHQPAAT